VGAAARFPILESLYFARTGDTTCRPCGLFLSGRIQFRRNREFKFPTWPGWWPEVAEAVKLPECRQG